ncbi:MAG: D-aminoacyl-tRNA deacylase [Flavobacteriales bacterium]|nr:D-aminoacyl-tRNA deacylase [Flavobacteriales bacterium]
MRAVVQKVSRASVQVEGKTIGSCGPGFMILLGVHAEDTEEDAAWLAQKTAALRVFSDADGKMNQSILDISGEALVVSQFTLHAKYKKGARPSFIHAARPEKAIPLYERFVRQLEDHLKRPVATGQFGAMMEVDLVNDGPVTITMDTRNKE